MYVDILKRCALFIALLLVQALVLNNIHLFGFATPLLYVYFAMSFRRYYPKAGILVWCFLMGLAVDVFSNTPGVAAASMTLMGLIQPHLFSLFIQHDNEEDFEPSMTTLGVSKYIYYTLMFVPLYCIIFFALEAFSFYDIVQWLACVGGSMALTTILILVIENVRRKDE